MSNRIKINFSSNAGAGETTPLEVESSVTVGELFAYKMGPTARYDDYTTRVNRQPTTGSVPRSYVLQEGDRVSISPSKVEGQIVSGVFVAGRFVDDAAA